MSKVIIKNFSGKDGRKWENLVFIHNDIVAQWFGEENMSPLADGIKYNIISIVTNGKYGVVNLVAENDSPVAVFVKIII